MGTKNETSISQAQFEVLRCFAEGGGSSSADGAVIADLKAEGLLGEEGLTSRGLAALAPYQVDNAIIMAAGFSGRCMPLSSIMPKGLFLVKGEVLIEREIRQLKEAGIEEIIVVVGFLQEKFDYLRDKYGVTLLVNADFDRYNNMSSLYAAQDHIRNSYILCSDNYYVQNVFHRYVYAPYYSCVYSDAFCDEYCVTSVDKDGYITGVHRGGERQWYTIGDAYFDRALSQKFVALMNQEWGGGDICGMLMDDFHIAHIQELKLRKVERPENSIFEFDTLEEFKAFDPDFSAFLAQNLDLSNEVIKIFSKYAGVKSYHSVPTETSFGRLHLNENLFKPSPACMEVLKAITEEDIYLYDLARKDVLIDRLSSVLDIPENNIFAHNGSAEVIKSIFSILLNENDRVLIPNPGWSYYKSVADEKFAKCIPYRVYESGDRCQYDMAELLAKADQQQPRIIVITTPHMPTGCTAEYSDIEAVVRKNPNSVILIDEAYWGYGDDTNVFEKNLIARYSNVVISRTFSKFYGLANLRIGYGLCSYPLKRTIGLDLPLFRECGISRKIAVAALEDCQYYRAMKEKTVSVREWFIQELKKIPGVKPFQSAANFVYVRLLHADAARIRAYMEENHLLIRLFTGEEDLRLRITVGPQDMMERVLFQLRKAMQDCEQGISEPSPGGSWRRGADGPEQGAFPLLSAQR